MTTHDDRTGEVGGNVDDALEALRRYDPLADPRDTAARVERERRRARGLGPLDTFLHDPSVTEIMVNGPGPIWVERAGGVEASGAEIDGQELERAIDLILDPLGLRVDRSEPVVDARLADGSRVNVVVPPLATGGPLLTIRRFGRGRLPLTAFGDRSLVDLLRALMADRRTVLVVGGTSSGKTSLLNALGACFDPDERIVTIEDTAELQLPGRGVVSLEARRPNREGVGEVTLRELVRNSLRMRPDRLVIGEVRGSEALDLVLALSAGHEGSLATCHASGPEAAIHRLETLALLGSGQVPAGAVRALVTAALDVVVHVRRIGARRAVAEVAAVPDRPGAALRTLWSAQPKALAS